ncbi:S8 family serine peptidase [Clostridiaceae bacterium M8S5]|nr:S8 family serine peptidase [Clostridiaceae bacterium M8S5]
MSSGTSMAAPFTAGTIALILDANSSLTTEQIKNIITSTAEDWSSNGQDIDYGFGRLDGYEAIKQAGGFSSGINIVTPNHIYKSEDLAQKGATDIWEFNVNNTDYPIAITLIMDDWKYSLDFDVYLYDPSGNKLGSSTYKERQENIYLLPKTTGTYKIRVFSYHGSGKYNLDLSTGGNNLILVQDQ